MKNVSIPTTSALSRSARDMLMISAVLVTVTLLGCGGGEGRPEPERAAVSGTVTFNSEPVKAGTVLFEFSETGAGSAFEISAGKFSGTGVPVGKHGISILPKANEEVSTDGGPPIAPPATADDIPPKYYATQTSGLTAEVKSAEGNAFEFKLQ